MRSYSKRQCLYYNEDQIPAKVGLPGSGECSILVDWRRGMAKWFTYALSPPTRNVRMLPTHQIWYLVPLLVSISLVYGATRHEEVGPILKHAYHSGLWMMSFMCGIFAVLLAFDWWFN